MQYPGRVIKPGEQDAVLVQALKKQLNVALGIAADPALRLDESDPNFGPKMKNAIKLFQVRNVDSSGRPLRQDGEIGSLTWEALFGPDTVASSNATTSQLLGEALRIAAGEEANLVREVPRNSNRGPRVEQYLARAGAAAGNAWCCAFVFWCLDEAAKAQSRPNPMVKTAGCLDHWNRAKSGGATRIDKRDAVADPAILKPGMIFIIDHGGGLGHTGLIETVAGGLLTTVEGNTDASKTREGGGVYRLTRKVVEINKGFIDYATV